MSSGRFILLFAYRVYLDSIKMGKMNERTIIAFGGLPLTGKSTLAKFLEERLKISRIDIDEVRRLLFKYHPVDPEKDCTRDTEQMRASWGSFFALVENALYARESVIVVGTFSRESYHQRLMSITEKHKAFLKFIFCYAPDEVIADRITLRLRDKEEPSNLRSMEGYERVKARYKRIAVPHLLNLDTSKPMKECLAKIVDFVR